MAENDSMEGKKLELHMFEQKILEAIEIAEKQKEDTAVINNGQIQFEIQIEKEDKKIKIHAFGEEVLTLEEGNFSYNIEGLKNIQEKLEENPEFDYSKFGLPDIEYLEELEKQKQENEKEDKQKDEKDLSKDEKEKEKDEPEDGFTITPVGHVKERVSMFEKGGLFLIKGWWGKFGLEGNRQLIQIAIDCGLSAKNSSGWVCVTIERR